MHLWINLSTVYALNGIFGLRVGHVSVPEDINWQVTPTHQADNIQETRNKQPTRKSQTINSLNMAHNLAGTFIVSLSFLDTAQDF